MMLAHYLVEDMRDRVAARARYRIGHSAWTYTYSRLRVAIDARTWHMSHSVRLVFARRIPMAKAVKDTVHGWVLARNNVFDRVEDGVIDRVWDHMMVGRLRRAAFLWALIGNRVSAGVSNDSQEF